MTDAGKNSNKEVLFFPFTVYIIIIILITAFDLESFYGGIPLLGYL